MVMMAPRVERKKKRPSRNQGGGDMPRSAGGYVLRQIRPRLPIQWQYGWRWKCIQGGWLLCAFAFLAKLGHTMFFALTDEEIDKRAAQYTYVRNDQGVVVDIAYKPLIDAAMRAKKRTAKYLEEDD